MRMISMLVALLMAVPVFAVEMGDDGLHKPDWLRTTFKDLSEDLESANAEGKRLVLIIEQRGCIYCNKMHNEIFPDPKVDAMIRDNFFFVQINMFGDEEVTDFDGKVMTEKELSQRWGLIFTPTMVFMPDVLPKAGNGAQNAILTMPGAFGKYTTFNILKFVSDKVYETDEPFQKFHARMLKEQGVIN